MNILGTQNLTQQSYVLAKYASSNQGGGIYYWLHEGVHTAEMAGIQLEFFASSLDIDLNVFFLDPARSDFASGLQALLQSKPGFYLCSADFFPDLQKSISLCAENLLRISTEQTLSPNQLKKRLVDNGYSQHEDESFHFIAKAGVITLTMGQSSYRILFDEDGIESITHAETNESLTELMVLPAEIDLTKLPAVDIDLPKGKKVFKETLLKPSGADDEIVLRAFTRDQMAGDLVVNQLEDLLDYRRQYHELIKDIESWQNNGYTITLSALDPNVVQTGLEREAFDYSTISLLSQGGPMEGFIDHENKLVFVTHSEILGRKEIKQRKRRDDNAFVTKLEVNDYVVHEDHGVARYVGMNTTEIEGHSRENLVLEYAKGDKLYVPVELAYKVDKYIGEAKPKLQRLSGTQWVRLSRKASQESQEYAQELLKLYARRSLVQVDPWTVFKDADEKLHETFAFTETPDQELAIKDVYADLTKSQPMDRLVVGDVGFGKTEVAVRAALQGVLNHKQVAVLCPTTLLAAQHYETFKSRLAQFGVRVEMLSRFTGKVGKTKGSITVKDVVAGLKAGEIDIVIGTHRLLSKDVDFKSMGMVIIDEEQRFGVKHKEALKRLRSQAHILTLSATPIPRTLYFSLSGLRDISTIQTPPKGRQPIETSIHEYNQEMVKKAIEAELKRGGQAFYLYNKVQTIQTMKRKLQELLGAKVKIGIVHGQMPASEMARVASEFGAGKIDVLVCTTIVENGLDLPNVNTLIVHNATRFGIGQLYQIRGRIGRGSVKAFAYLLYPESGISGVAERRLQILEEAKELGSGFQLAMRDLEMRGMGQMLGQKQHGHIQKVGLSMYGKLLRQAVEEYETGEVTENVGGVKLNIPLDYGIPESVVPVASERLRLYKLLSQAETEQEIHEILSTFDSNHRLIEGLVQLLTLKIQLRNTPMRGIDYQVIKKEYTTELRLELTFDHLTPQYLDQIYTVASNIKVQGDKEVIIFLDQEKQAIEFAQQLVKLLQIG